MPSDLFTSPPAAAVAAAAFVIYRRSIDQFDRSIRLVEKNWSVEPYRADYIEGAREALSAAHPIIVREVVAACVEVVKRARIAEEDRQNKDRGASVCGITAMNAAHECGEAIEAALAALVPPDTNEEGTNDE